ncbi:MAG: flagellar biosynthesis protein FlgN [Sulfitobacter sp.]
MDEGETRAHIEALNRLLEAERESLLNGQLDDLAEMVPDKERLLAVLQSGKPAEKHALHLLDQKVKRNQMLLNGALEGIRSVAQRLATLRQMRGSLETYDAQGGRKTVDTGNQTSVEKRA